MVILKARDITLDEVEQFLGFTPLYDGKFQDFLVLEQLSESELQELQQIRLDFLNYVRQGKVSEGQARQIAVNPLLKLAGYHRSPIELRIEEDIERIYIEDEDTHSRGRLDILAINRQISTSPTSLLWVLIIESKNLAASEFAGIAQMLTYAHSGLEHQSATWGLVTNGATYQFFHITKNESSTYQYLPTLSLMESDRAIQLLQVLKAILDWTPDDLA